jgi:hypothetical protein
MDRFEIFHVRREYRLTPTDTYLLDSRSPRQRLGTDAPLRFTSQHWPRVGSPDYSLTLGLSQAPLTAPSDVEGTMSKSHVVRVVDDGTEVQIDIYRSGPCYGLWILTVPPEGHEVRVEHAIPTEFSPDGGWCACRPKGEWVVPAEAWERDPMMFEEWVGKRVARDAVPLLRFPKSRQPRSQPVRLKLL